MPQLPPEDWREKYAVRCPTCGVGRGSCRTLHTNRTTKTHPARLRAYEAMMANNNNNKE